MIQTIDWQVSETFKTSHYTMRGIRNKVAFIDAPFTDGREQKYMWHFWGVVPEGEFTVIGVKEGSDELSPVLTRGSQSVWTYHSPGGQHADEHLPSTMSVRESGKWALLIYIGEEYFDQIIVEVN
ncbi:DUF4871 domain-containing protein [Rossellomorea aquimaris]|uniref:DUF4871 domain-containing protein n=1 Tax=Rossellomorea aquimaris TaxID=189382 RepID=UPI001CD4C13D|nr:DUF4871 domain-containing protein [Rossellomorea aquimaris]MCA1054148.1 DUF4871 domain-containing protein [Rossellomorea aquimaris]